MSHSPFSIAFQPGTRFARDDDDVLTVSVRAIGSLRVPTGQILVGDPLTGGVGADAVPLSRVTPVGEFPVELSIVKDGEGEQRVACARLRFRTDVAATRYEPALVEGEVVPTSGAVPGYAVDSSNGCFADAVVRGLDDEASLDAWLKRLDGNERRSYTWDLADVGPANLAMFSAGEGDSIYSSYWGVDDEGGLVELVTDFDLLVRQPSESFEVPLPLSPGPLEHPLLAAHGVAAHVSASGQEVVCSGPDVVVLEITKGDAVSMDTGEGTVTYSWKRARPGAALKVIVLQPAVPLDVVP